MKGEHIQEIPIDLIDVEPQVRERFAEASLAQLAKQIARHGLLQAIRLRRLGDRYAIVFGERRFLAAKLAGLKAIAARVIDREMTAGDIAIQQLIENCHEALNPMERAKGIAKAMAENGMTARQVAIELGETSESSISNALGLLTLPMSIQDSVESGKIAASAGSGLARVEDPQLQATLASRLASGELTRDGLRGAIRAATNGGGEGKKLTPRRVTAALGPNRTVTVSEEGLDLEGLIKTLEDLLAKARKARARGIELSTFIKVLRDEAKRDRQTAIS